MLEEPYRWIEAIRNRREYLEDQLQGASPVVGMAYKGGLLLLTTTPGPRKLFEVYNEIAFAAIGHPADIEKLRKAVIDIAHVEGFNLSANDVSLQRLVSFGIGPLMKGAFDEIFHSPFIARVLLAELTPDGGDFYAIDADGSFAQVGQVAAVAGTEAGAEGIVARLKDADGSSLELEDALRCALEAWACGRLLVEGGETAAPDEARIADFLGQTLAEIKIEAAVLDQGRATLSKFRLLQPTDLEPLLASYAD